MGVEVRFVCDGCHIKVRRVDVNKRIMTGEETSSGWVYPNPNGTHMLVPVKAWPKLSPKLLGKIGDEIIRQTGDGPLAIYVVEFLKEIGGEDDRDIVKLDIEEMRKQWESGGCEIRRRDALEADDA